MRKKIGIGIVTLLLLSFFFPLVASVNLSSDSYVSATGLSEVEWEKTYGGDEADKFWDVQDTDDGGFIACGTTEVDNNHCPWVVKVDSDGNEIWEWTITEFDNGGYTFDITYSYCDCVQQTSDGGYIIGISAFIFNYNEEEHDAGGLLKLDSNGDVEWMQLYGDPLDWIIGVEFVVEVEDGFVGAGSNGPSAQGSSPERDSDVCLFRTDSDGELVWHQEYDYSDKANWARGFGLASDGGYIIVGDGNVGDGAERSPIMIKTDSQGNEEWHKFFEDVGSDYFWNAYQTSDGGYIAAGGSQDLLIVKTDANGNEIWIKSFGESSIDLGWDFDQTDDGGYLASVMINVAGLTTESWVLKVDSEGNAEWKHIYGGSGEKKYFMAISPTNDGGCIASGISGAWDGSRSDALLVKYAAFENQRPSKPATPTGPARGKPETEYTFKTTGATDPDGDQLTYRWDWGDGEFTDGTNEESYTWTSEDNFEVRVMAIDEHGGESDWSDPLPFSTPRIKQLNLIELVLGRLLDRFPLLYYLL